jgi:hypothetical protein
MKIAEVWVNIKNLPTKETLISQALKSKKYYQLPQKKALTLINEEIKASGLFKETSKRVKKTDRSTSTASKPRVVKQRKSNKKKD